MHTKKSFGLAGQVKVEEFLQKNGFAILARNYTIRGGEVDLIVSKGLLLIFVEIKTRKKGILHHTAIITQSKKHAMQKTACHYLMVNKIDQGTKIIRFDVAFVIDDAIEYIENAF